jgi:hypothetical protein
MSSLTKSLRTALNETLQESHEHLHPNRTGETKLSDEHTDESYAFNRSVETGSNGRQTSLRSSLVHILLADQTNRTVGPSQTADCAIINQTQTRSPFECRTESSRTLPAVLNDESQHHHHHHLDHHHPQQRQPDHGRPKQRPQSTDESIRQSNSESNLNELRPNQSCRTSESSVIGRLQRLRTVTERRPVAVLLLLCIACSTCLVLRSQLKVNDGRSIAFDRLDHNQVTRLDQLSEFDQALAVRTDCGFVVGNVEQGAFVFKVRIVRRLFCLFKLYRKVNLICQIGSFLFSFDLLSATPNAKRELNMERPNDGNHRSRFEITVSFVRRKKCTEQHSSAMSALKFILSREKPMVRNDVCT